MVLATLVIYIGIQALPNARGTPFDLGTSLAGYLGWVDRLVHLDLGRTAGTLGQPVGAVIARRLEATLLLATCAILLSACVSFALGTLAAAGRGGPLDLLVNLWITLTLAFPGFIWVLFLLTIFAVELRVLPVGDFVSPFKDPGLGLKHLILPVVVVSLEGMGDLTRIVRHMVLEVLDEDFVRTATSKGLAGYVILARHALPNVFVPVTTQVGLTFGRVIGGTIVVEQIFNLPGMGRTLLGAVNARDMNLVEGVMLVYATLFVVVMLAVDVIYAIVDPRIRRRAAVAR